jgi:hypothetical protein
MGQDFPGKKITFFYILLEMGPMSNDQIDFTGPASYPYKSRKFNFVLIRIIGACGIMSGESGKIETEIKLNGILVLFYHLPGFNLGANL